MALIYLFMLQMDSEFTSILYEHSQRKDAMEAIMALSHVIRYLSYRRLKTLNVFRSNQGCETKIVGHFPMLLRLLDSAYPGMVHSVLRHGDSMTDPAQRTESVKITQIQNLPP